MPTLKILVLNSYAYAVSIPHDSRRPYVPSIVRPYGIASILGGRRSHTFTFRIMRMAFVAPRFPAPGTG